jgi:uncharacterized protein (TIGR00661 family)
MVEALQRFPECKRVLIAPLNWGLGHATRSIPLINTCLNLGKQVRIASDGVALDLLNREFPDLQSYTLPGYNINYAKHFTGLRIALQAPKIAWAMYRERLAVAKIVAEYRPDLILSDNRFGVHHASAKCIILSHQTQLNAPFALFEGIVRYFNRRFINGFDECWIPDHLDHRLSGTLSNTDGLKAFQFIGPLSRLAKLQLPTKRQILLLLSGPEPQRSILEAMLTAELLSLPYSFALVRGTNIPRDKSLDSSIESYDLVNTDLLQHLLAESQLIISRTGYTTVMDLDYLEKQAILIPTPGQPEQEYLGRHLAEHPYFSVVEQSKLQDQLSDCLSHLLQ